MKHVFTVFLLSQLYYSNAGNGGPKLTKNEVLKNSNVYLISVGINTFRDQNDIFLNSRNNEPYKLPLLAGCVLDALSFETKVEKDFKKLKVTGAGQNFYSITLTNLSACKDSIKKAFDRVAYESTPKDVFIFFYAGITRENRNDESYIIPYLTQTTDSLFANTDLIPLSTVAKWMNSIQASHQLIVSEAGMGEPFSLNLIEQLFESNPVLASQDLRNRIIISTKTIGHDSYKSCKDNVTHKGGPLNHNLCRMDNIFKVFYEPELFEYRLHEMEQDCPIGSFPYAMLLNEKAFTKILSHRVLKTRGALTVNNPKAEKKIDLELPAVNYALLIAANNYEGKPDWTDLGNPKNDAKAIGKILGSKLEFKVKYLFNVSRDSLTWELIRYKSLLREKDNLIIFFAGHGYYDADFSDGYLVFPKSKSLKNDKMHDTYLAMATLNRLIDNLPSKNIFVIFDICFGASFDFKAKDLALSSYKAESDIGIDTLIKRKNAYYSRIFLSSGKGSVYDYWFNSGSHSPFASKLIDYLNKETELVCPGRMYAAVEQNITEPVLKEFGKHDPKGDMILKVLEKK